MRFTVSDSISQPPAVSREILRSYVLMTAARNEEKYIERTIRSVLTQDVLPIRWVIVSDGSIDNTDAIINSFRSRDDRIELVRSDNSGERDFRSKIRALRCAADRLRAYGYDFIGNLDADIELPPDFYRRLLEKMQNNEKLGIASGLYLEADTGKYSSPVMPARRHTFGSTQLFRRECFDEIGGYPLLDGGEDTIAGVLARMHEWETQHFPDITAVHLKPMGIMTNAHKNRFAIRRGQLDFDSGIHPVFLLFKLARRAMKPGNFLFSILSMYGFFASYVTRRKRPIDRSVVRFYRREQLKDIMAALGWKQV
jgi:poly-beta-1,6-N-acetyl-D-glucosamine synthase